MKGLTAVDLFAGAGLFSYAFAREGFSITRAVEIDRSAAATYARNLGAHVEVTDIRAIRPSGRCDALIAAPPCQGYSTLGKRRADDPRNFLSLEVIRWAKVLRPKIVVIENVAAFLQSPVWQQLARGLRRIGYDVDASVCDAYEFGVPQLRLRSFTFASRVGIPTPKPRRLRLNVRDAFDGLPSRPDGKNFHIAPTPSAIALSRMKLIPPGGDKRDVMRRAPQLAAESWWRLGCNVTDAWGRMEWDTPCNTLRTDIQNASKGRYIHPDQHRVISLREAARIHSIPDSWTFEGYAAHIARQIGNSVPPGLGRAVARAVRESLD